MSSAEDYWKTLEGILVRIADLAHHFTWHLVNSAIREGVGVIEAEEERSARERGVAPPPPRRLLWVTMADLYGYGGPHGVCPICEENEDEYESDEVLPDMPAHVMCRCHWKIV